MHTTLALLAFEQRARHQFNSLSWMIKMHIESLRAAFHNEGSSMPALAYGHCLRPSRMVPNVTIPERTRWVW